jgi:hypothetical protein
LVNEQFEVGSARAAVPEGLGDGVALLFNVAEEDSILHAVNETLTAHMIMRKNFISEAILARALSSALLAKAVGM